VARNTDFVIGFVLLQAMMLSLPVYAVDFGLMPGNERTTR
jgi:hypothetical protein